jgi:hypothetical protein
VVGSSGGIGGEKWGKVVDSGEKWG